METVFLRQKDISLVIFKTNRFHKILNIFAKLVKLACNVKLLQEMCNHKIVESCTNFYKCVYFIF